MRFAVHRPGIPEASPRGARHTAAIFLAAFTSALQAYPQAVRRQDRARLSRDVRVHLPARRAPLSLREVRLDPLDPSSGPSAPRGAPAGPSPTAGSPGSSPVFARTFRPGLTSRCSSPSPVMLPDLQVPPHPGPGTRTAARYRSAALSAQSLRRSVSRQAFSRAIASRTRPRRFDPRRARASLRSSRRMRDRCPPGQAGNVQHRPEYDRAAATATPRSIPRTSAVARRGDRLADRREGDVPAPGPVQGHLGRT